VGSLHPSHLHHGSKGRDTRSNDTIRSEPTRHTCVLSNRDIACRQRGVELPNQRHRNIANKPTYALLMHNEALSQSLIQAAACLYNMSLDILVSRRNETPGTPEKRIRQRLKNGVNEAVDACDGLVLEERNAYKALLGSRVDQGLASSLTDKTRRLLMDLGIIGEAPSDSIDRRIRFMNAVRNRLVHTGEYASLPSLSEDQSKRYNTAIAIGVVPEINVMALGQILGFERSRIGSLRGCVAEQRPGRALGGWRHCRAGVLSGHPGTSRANQYRYRIGQEDRRCPWVRRSPTPLGG
jgi:hypothetical protein